MPRDNKQKIKLLYLMEILRQDTDEQHPISTNQICKRLAEQGISCERRTVGMDMKVLNDYGYEIMSKMVGHEKAYYMAYLIQDLKNGHKQPPSSTHPHSKRQQIIRGLVGHTIGMQNLRMLNAGSHKHPLAMYGTMLKTCRQ